MGRVLNTYDWWLGAYLAAMQAASDSAGTRLLDVLDLHWYPEAQGEDSDGTQVRITSGTDNSPGVAWARMQAPRTLWDSSYKENSWIAEWNSPVALLPHIFGSIAKYNPGTRLAFTEFDYGGAQDISGGVATADVLGLFGKYGVYMSSHWGALTGFTLAAYQLYRNFDKTSATPRTFGDVRVSASTNNDSLTSVYAASEGIADQRCTLCSSTATPPPQWTPQSR